MCYKNGEVFDEYIFLTWHINRRKLMLVGQMVVWSLSSRIIFTVCIPESSILETFTKPIHFIVKGRKEVFLKSCKGTESF